MWGTKSTKLEIAELAVKKLEDANRLLNHQLQDQARLHRIMVEDLNKDIAELKKIEETLTKKFNDEKALAFKTMELEFKSKMQEELNKVRVEAQEKVNKGIEENFNKLKDSLAKLHEEGSAQTKFTEQIALKMMGALSPAKTAPLLGE